MSSNKTLTRPACESDLEQMYAIELAAHQDAWTKTLLRDCLNASYDYSLLEKADHTIIGFIISTTAAQETHLLNVSIHPDYQRQGYGQILLEELIQNALKQQSQQIFLEVRVSNTAARQLYTKMGFTEIGRRKAYYPLEQGREDAVVLALDISKAPFLSLG